MIKINGQKRDIHAIKTKLPDGTVADIKKVQMLIPDENGNNIARTIWLPGIAEVPGEATLTPFVKNLIISNGGSNIYSLGSKTSDAGAVWNTTSGQLDIWFRVSTQVLYQGNNHIVSGYVRKTFLAVTDFYPLSSPDYDTIDYWNQHYRGVFKIFNLLQINNEIYTLHGSNEGLTESYNAFHFELVKTDIVIRPTLSKDKFSVVRKMPSTSMPEPIFASLTAKSVVCLNAFNHVRNGWFSLRLEVCEKALRYINVPGSLQTHVLYNFNHNHDYSTLGSLEVTIDDDSLQYITTWFETHGQFSVQSYNTDELVACTDRFFVYTRDNCQISCVDFLGVAIQQSFYINPNDATSNPLITAMAQYVSGYGQLIKLFGVHSTYTTTPIQTTMCLRECEIRLIDGAFVCNELNLLTPAEYNFPKGISTHFGKFNAVAVVPVSIAGKTNVWRVVIQAPNSGYIVVSDAAVVGRPYKVWQGQVYFANSMNLQEGKAVTLEVTRAANGLEKTTIRDDSHVQCVPSYRINDTEHLVFATNRIEDPTSYTCQDLGMLAEPFLRYRTRPDNYGEGALSYIENAKVKLYAAMFYNIHELIPVTVEKTHNFYTPLSFFLRHNNDGVKFIENLGYEYLVRNVKFDSLHPVLHNVYYLPYHEVVNATPT